MSTIMVLGFAAESQSDEFRSTLGTLVDDGALEVEDAVTVSISAEGEPTYRHHNSVARGGALLGGILGGVVGLFFLNPVAGAAVGAAGGAAIGKLTGDYGVEEDFIHKTAEALKPGTAALFLQVRRIEDQTALDAAIQEAGATVITTRFNRAAEEALSFKLEDEQAES